MLKRNIYIIFHILRSVISIYIFLIIACTLCIYYIWLYECLIIILL